MKYYYLIHFQFLGFRFHGWQKQPGYKTIQGVIEENLMKILGRGDFTVLGASRTDSMVSAQNTYFELITEKEIKSDLLPALNQLLPADIKILDVKQVNSDFKIVNSPKTKEYVYLFSFGERNHPFSAPFMTHLNEELDIDLMKKAAALFIGTHYFKNYCYKPRETQNFEREVLESQIEENTILTANFFPEKSFVYKVKAKSFMRHQVRLMMGAIFKTGMGQLTLEEVEVSLQPDSAPVSMIAPASGLILHKIHFD
jgi:tRNA pseudouridine38-40 synthase